MFRASTSSGSLNGFWQRNKRNTDAQRETCLKNVLLENELPGDIPLKALEFMIPYTLAQAGVPYPDRPAGGHRLPGTGSEPVSVQKDAEKSYQEASLALTVGGIFEIESHLNGSETSRQLFVHRNTLVYRLDKVQKITGLDLRSFDDAVLFKLASMVRKYLEKQDKGPLKSQSGKWWHS